MSSVYWSGAVTTVLATIALLVAHQSESRRGVWLTKPVAATGFVVAALGAGAMETSFGRAVLVGLACSWLGDVLLIEQRTFLAGLVAFLLGHVAFAVGFVLRGVSPLATACAALGLAPGIVLVWRWLAPHVGKLRMPVAAYVAVISAMVALAVGASYATPSALALTGAVAFFLSDLCVARQRFIAAQPINQLIGLPLYFGAQLFWAAASGR